MAAAVAAAPRHAIVSPCWMPEAALPSTNFSALHMARLHVVPFMDFTFRCGPIPLMIRLKKWSGGYATLAIPKCAGFSMIGFEFRSGAGRRCTALRKGGGAWGGNLGSFNHNCGEIVEEGVLDEFLMVILGSLEFRIKQLKQWAPRLVVLVGIVTLARILVSRSTLGRVLAASCCATLVAGIFSLLLVDSVKLRLMSMSLQPIELKARHELYSFSKEVAHDLDRFLVSSLSSSIPALVPLFERELSSHGNFVTSRPYGVAILVDLLSGVAAATGHHCRELQRKLPYKICENKVEARDREPTADVLSMHFGLLPAKLVDCGGLDDRKKELASNPIHLKFSPQ